PRARSSTTPINPHPLRTGRPRARSDPAAVSAIAHMDADPSANPNFVTLGDRDEYRRYFDLLSTVVERIRTCYRASDPDGSYEAGIAPGFVEKLRNTIALLRVKYMHAGAGTRPLWIDVTESGFPNAMELDGLKQDVLRRKERLLQLPVAVALKRVVL